MKFNDVKKSMITIIEFKIILNVMAFRVIYMIIIIDLIERAFDFSNFYQY